ncbi:multidrug efflux SMR transporter [Bradyrhizobium prioriisuperbiae]|uniref:DMT family transporter n=1 Tax=Bradyrhizobium prioriisuperbiae TaxID=2854389 RepID=UPI0028F073D2|nr:multidrug efflux SMR transporter [Bradyrhizobium prioritasuperba]
MTHNLAWGLLVLAGLLDVAWAGAMKLNEGFTRLSWSVISLLLLAALVAALGQAVKVLPVGTAYAVWTGIGAVGTVVLGLVVFQESLGVGRLVCLALVVGGVVGLKLLETT